MLKQLCTNTYSTIGILYKSYLLNLECLDNSCIDSYYSVKQALCMVKLLID